MILITGGNGQLGTELSKLLSDAIRTDSTELDITDEGAVVDFVKSHDVDVIINCAAYTNVDNAEDNVDIATKVNVDGPRNLAKTGVKIIHISTDYVFDGKGCKPYKPEDIANPISVYGKTKFAGEQEVIKNASVYAIIRTAWLYSPYGKNFVKTMRSLGETKESLNVVSDQVGSPTYAGDLADAIVKIIPQLTVEKSGVYHFTNEGVCSWYDFATEIMDRFNLNCKVNPIPSSAYPTKATRPFCSVLDKSKIKQVFGIEIPHWKKGLEKCLKQF